LLEDFWSDVIGLKENGIKGEGNKNTEPLGVDMMGWPL
jgi:hypothetical protein